MVNSCQKARTLNLNVGVDAHAWKPRARSGAEKPFLVSEFALNPHRVFYVGFCKSFTIAMKSLSALDFSLLLTPHSPPLSLRCACVSLVYILLNLVWSSAFCTQIDWCFLSVRYCSKWTRNSSASFFLVVQGAKGPGYEAGERSVFCFFLLTSWRPLDELFVFADSHFTHL